MNSLGINLWFVMVMVACTMAKEETGGPSSSGAMQVQDRKHMEPEDFEGSKVMIDRTVASAVASNSEVDTTRVPTDLVEKCKRCNLECDKVDGLYRLQFHSCKQKFRTNGSDTFVHVNCTEDCVGDKIIC